MVSISLAVLVFAATSLWILVQDIQPARAADFVMQTGYYVGSGADNLQITAPGWSPDLVIIRLFSGGAGNTNNTFFKTSAMSGENTSVIGPTDTVASDAIQSLDATGFTVGTTNVNDSNSRYNWVAFDGSDCTSAGTFCVGSYTGNGAASQAITSVGFQPDLVMVKGTTTEVMWRSSAMATDVANYTTTSGTSENTTGAYFKTLDATGFTVGNNEAVNFSATTYFFIAFKQIATKMKVARYTGNGVDNTSITGVGFQPDFLFVKNSTGTSNAWGMFATQDMLEDHATYLGGGGGLSNEIQKFESDGFQAGNRCCEVNGNGVTYSYAAFGGATDPTGSGTFKMATGSYVGTGSGFSVTGLGFAPNLVIIKSTNASTVQGAYFKTSVMYGNTEAFGSLSSVADAITSLDSAGFTLGAAAQVNTSGDTYHWQAFGNAFSPVTQSGAADFAVGAYIGDGVDNRNVVRMIPFQPDLVVVKRRGAAAAVVLRTSSHNGDAASSVTASADITNCIQAFNTDGIQAGTNISCNAANSQHPFFAFKTGTNFKVAKYKGTGSSQSFTAPGFRPELVWVKSTSTIAGVFRPDTLTGDSTMYFINTANAANLISSIDGTGFTVGMQIETSQSGTAYIYEAWNDSTVRWGTLYSASIDTDSYSTIASKNALHMTWNQTVPTGCRLWMYIRSTNTGPTPDYATSTWQGPYWSATSTPRQDLTGISALQSKRFFQYRADMYSCKQNTNYPTLLDVSTDFD